MLLPSGQVLQKVCTPTLRSRSNTRVKRWKNNDLCFFAVGLQIALVASTQQSGLAGSTSLRSPWAERNGLQRDLLDGLRFHRATAGGIRPVPHSRRGGSRSPPAGIQLPAALRTHAR